jgi:hypothetical protein
VIWVVLIVAAICLIAYWTALLIFWLGVLLVGAVQAGARFALDRYYKED